MDRVSLYLIDFPSGLSGFVKAVEKNKESDKGFLIEHHDNKVVRGSFFEKIKINERYTNPFSHEDDIVSYSFYKEFKFEFFLYKSKAFMMVVNPPQSSKGFVNFISKIGGGLVVFEPITISIKNFFEVLDKEGLIDIIKATVASVKINEKSLATMTILSPHDALSDFEGFYQRQDYIIKSVKIRYQNIFGEGVFEVTNKSSIYFQGEEVSELVRSIVRYVIDTYFFEIEIAQ